MHLTRSSAPRLLLALAAALAFVLLLAPASRAAGNPQTWLVNVTPAEDETNQTTITFAFGGNEDVASYECRLEPAPWAPCANPVTVSVPDGLNRFWFRGVDELGAAETDPLAWAWFVDSTALAPTVTEAPPARTHATDARIAFAGEERATFACSLDGAPFAACADALELRGLSAGDHAVEVRQTDRLGNVSPAARVSWTVLPDLPAPTFGPAPRTGVADPTFTFSGEPGATFECRVDGGPWTACASPFSAAGLAPGTHAIEVRQRDDAGGVSPAAVLRHVVSAPARRPPAPVPTRASISAPARTTAPAGRLAVGCGVNRGPLRRCAFDVLLDGRRAGGGTATFRGRRGRGAVTLTLSSRARRAVARPGGVAVQLRLRARGGAGGTLRAAKTVRLLPPTALAVPSTGMFASGSARLLPSGARFLRALAPDLVNARTVRCTGHTDANGSAASNLALGLARARAVCAALRANGMRRARTTTASAGESRPRASNDTATGRALNRRVELTIRY